MTRTDAWCRSLLVCVSLGSTACEKLEAAADRMADRAERQKAVPPVTPTAHFQTQTTPPPDTKIRMSKSGCFGTCPVYVVEVGADGTVVFVGTDHVARFGNHVQKIPTDDVLKILREADAVGFFNMTAEWLAKSCREPATDLPTTRLSIEAGKQTLAVADYHGCDMRHPMSEEPREAAPRYGLRKLQALVRETVVLDTWLEPSRRQEEYGQQLMSQLASLMPKSLAEAEATDEPGAETTYESDTLKLKVSVGVGPRWKLQLRDSGLEPEDTEIDGFRAKRVLQQRPKHEGFPQTARGEVLVWPSPAVQVRLEADGQIVDVDELTAIARDLPLKELRDAWERGD